MGSDVLVAYAFGAAAAQALVAVLALRSPLPEAVRRSLAALFGLNGVVAAAFGIGLILGLAPGNSGGWPGQLASLADSPTPLLVAYLAVVLWAGRPHRPSAVALAVLWLLYPIGRFTSLDDALGLAFSDWFSSAFVKVSYAALVVVASWRASRPSGASSSVGAWILAAFGVRAAEFSVYDARELPGSFQAAGEAASFGLPAVILIGAALLAACGTVARLVPKPRRHAAAGAVFLLGVAYGVALDLSRGHLGPAELPFLTTLTLFVVRPLVVAAGLLPPPAAAAALVAYAAGAVSWGVHQGARTLFPDLPGAASWLVSLAVLGTLLLVASQPLRSALVNVGGPRVPVAAERVGAARAHILARLPASTDAGLAQDLAQLEVTQRLLLALRGSEGTDRLYDATYAQAGLCAVARVHYKKLASVLRGLETAYADPSGESLVIVYGVRRRKYYRLSARGGRVADSLARSVGAGDWSAPEVQAALLAAGGEGAADRFSS